MRHFSFVLVFGWVCFWFCLLCCFGFVFGLFLVSELSHSLLFTQKLWRFSGLSERALDLLLGLCLGCRVSHVSLTWTAGILEISCSLRGKKNVCLHSAHAQVDVSVQGELLGSFAPQAKSFSECQTGRSYCLTFVLRMQTCE